MVHSENGLLSTVCYKIGDQDAVYALEGSIAVTGSLVQWLRDNLGIIGSAPEVSRLASTVDDSGGAYFVPAFSGLFAPYWRLTHAAPSSGSPDTSTRRISRGRPSRRRASSPAT